MKALLTNDDGIRAPGIRALYGAIRDRFEELRVVAPMTVQSATSHGVTFDQPLMTREVRFAPDIDPELTGVAVDGRPADCTKLALTNLWPEAHGDGTRPDLVVSGMNMGANVGINVIYSGTVAAAIEAAFLGVPAIAVSLHLGKGTADYDAAARHARNAIDAILESGPLDPHACISINVPRCEVEEGDARFEPRPLALCPMNTHGLVDSYAKRVSPAGGEYYWSTGSGLNFRGADPGTDVEALFERRITVTTLKYDMTDHDALARLRDKMAPARPD
ncbi:MAG: 5'/3'-nucleotidase SurE [Planctomycetota bacterium]